MGAFYHYHTNHEIIITISYFSSWSPFLLIYKFIVGVSIMLE